MAKTLAQHRWAHKFRGFPLHGRWEDGMEDEVVGYVDEPLWKWADLTEDQQAVVRQEAIDLQARASDLDWDTAFWYALGDYGIACPHKWEYHEPSFRECIMCRCMEQLPGRVVRVGDKTMRVPDPPPPVLRIPRPLDLTLGPADPSAFPELPVDEYHWTGRRYEIASR